jgi:DNA-binding transcriptional ArsR family regulator
MNVIRKLSAADKPTTAKDILEAVKTSYPTLSKYLLVLEAEGVIKVSDYGNIKFYYIKDDQERKRGK